MKRFYMLFSFIFFMFPIVFSFLAAFHVIVFQEKNDLVGTIMIAWLGGMLMGALFASFARDIEKEELRQKKYNDFIKELRQKTKETKMG